MRTRLSLVQTIGFCFVYVALGFLYPIFTTSLNPFENGMAHSFANGLGHRPRLWETSRVRSFPK